MARLTDSEIQARAVNWLMSGGNRGVLFGMVGILDVDETRWLIDVNDEPGFIHVRVLGSSGSEPVSTDRAFNSKVIPVPDTPVRMRRNSSGTLVVEGIEQELAKELYGDYVTNSDVGAHHHRRGGGVEQIVEMEVLEAGLVVPLDTTSLVVRVYPFAYATDSNNNASFDGGTIDLDGHEPSDTGMQRFVLVCLDTTDNTLVLVDGADKASVLPPLRSDISAITVSDDYITLCAVRLVTAQSTFTSYADFVDWRHWLTGANSGGSGGGYDTIQDDGSGVTQRTTLNFINGTVADDAGNTRTNVTLYYQRVTDVFGTAYTQQPKVAYFNGNNIEVSIANDNVDEQTEVTFGLVNDPTISSGQFGNMQHTHEDASEGGQLNASNVFNAGTVPPQYMTEMTGADGANPGTAGTVPAPAATDNTKFFRGDGTYANPSVPTRYRRGLRLQYYDVDELVVQTGEIVVENTLVEKTARTLLNAGTNGDWIGGTAAESSSAHISVYINASGDVKLHNKFPNYPRANTASRVFTAQVNQSGWNGTAGNGLNATSVVYDNDTGEGSLQPGMLLGVYTENTYSNGRGKGSAASGAAYYWSWAYIVSVNTSTNTLTLLTGHQIAINDNDYLITVEPGELLYRSESGTWWRWLGSIYNNASADFVAEWNNRAHRTVDNNATYTTNSATFVDIDSTSFSVVLATNGGDIRMDMTGVFGSNASAGRYLFTTFAVDGTDYVGGDGIGGERTALSGDHLALHFHDVVPQPPPGTHTVNARWKRGNNSVTLNLFSGNGATDEDVIPQFTVEERYE